MIEALGGGAYAGILVAAAFEGEIAFVAAALLVGQGLLHPAGVVAAGATGAAIGDQFYFYLLRGRLRRWLDRVPAVARRSERLVSRVRRHDTAMVLAIRFAPGLRIALAAACAYAGVPPLKLSVLNALASVVWAVTLLTLVAYAGPAFLQTFGISGWWRVGIPAVIALVAVQLLRLARRALVDDGTR